MFLSPDDLVALTGCKRADAQARALQAMKVPHVLRPDGSPVVLRAYVETMLGGITSGTVVAPREPELQP